MHRRRSRIHVGWRAIRIASVALGTLAGGCASPSELVTVRNATGSAQRVAVVFGIRSGFAPTGLVVGPGALCRTLAAGETWTASAMAGECLTAVHSALPATTLMIRPPTRPGWDAFLVAWGDRGSREGHDRREVRLTIWPGSDGGRIEATDQHSQPLAVTPIGAATEGPAAAAVRGWMRELR